MKAFQKLKLLIWKNFLLQKRHKYQTVFEIASPVLFSLFLILIRCLVVPKSKPGISYPPYQPMYYNSSGREVANITTIKEQGTLAFSPEGTLPRKALKEALKFVAEENLSGILALLFDPKMLPDPHGYKDAATMEEALTKPNAMKMVLTGVQFDDSMANASKWPDHVKITIRFPATMRTPMVDNPIRLSWRTNLLFPLITRPGPREPEDKYGGKTPGYSLEMFLAVQHAVSHAIIKEKLGKDQELETKVQLQRFPQLPYRDDSLLIALEKFISMIIMLCFAYTFVNTVRVVTAEKELQLKETMTIMGLPSWLHWLAWFIKQFSFIFISVILVAILLKIPLTSTESGTKYSVLTFTPFSVILFFMVLFVIASLAFSFMVSVFFSRANTAASFMGLAWFTTYSIYMLTQIIYEDVHWVKKMCLSLISNVALGFAFQMIVTCEGTTRGLQWSDFNKPISYHDDFLPGHVAGMLVLDSIIYMLIAMYVEKVRPGKYGVPLRWYFPCTRRFWAPKKRHVVEVDNQADAEYNNALLNVVHDDEPNAVPTVNIQNLTKIFKKNKKKAVDNLNLHIYANEITVLLGHNGAGKTTTISMLTGTIPPTSGTAIVNGYNVVTQTEQARESLGICPQHNVLFPDLTVAEHLIFYSCLKGVPKDQLKSEVDNFVKLLELEDKRNVLSANLSGGQKRRLSVGTAMCGKSQIVLLDEPTSGLDPAARRGLWDLLIKEKKGRTMILTTHFMDEADVLGDRIAIMSGGKLQCNGTPYFLKKHYGIGYKLTIAKASGCSVDEITSFFKKYVPDITENTNIGSELTYILPNENVSKFPEMLKNFEEKKDELHVESYGLSVTSLEEVFMKVGAEQVEDSPELPSKRHHKDNAIVPIDHSKAIDTDPIQKDRGFKLLRSHIKAMFLKLIYNSTRNKLIMFIQIVSPIINISLSVIIARSWNFIRSLPPLTLSLESGFKATQTLISNSPNIINGSAEEKYMTEYKNYFKRASYPGLRYKDIGTKDMGTFYLQLSREDPERVRFENIIGATFEPDVITCWYSNYGYHDSAISLAQVDDAMMRAALPGSSLTIVNYPLPYSIENLLRVMATGGTMGFQFAFNMGFCFAFVSSFLVLFIIKERISGAKLLQRVSGVRPIVMWLVAFIWDWTWMFLIHIIIIITLACYQEVTLSTADELGRVLLVLGVFSVGIIPIHYILSFRFDAAATGFSKMCFVNIFTGCMPFIITEVLRLPEVGSEYYANVFDWIFSVMPLYCLSRSLRDMSVSSFALKACDALCDQFVNINNCTRNTLCTKLNITVCCIENYPFLRWDEPGIGRYLFMTTLVGVILFLSILLHEYQVFNKMCYKTNPLAPPPDPREDEDVRRERAYVACPAAGRDSLVCRDLTKYYKKFLAVNRLSFAVRKSECFGLLGVNGAGKTTTFRMLTGDEHISRGEALVHRLSVKTNLQEVYRIIGYCPQFDALLDNLTARENLHIFCLLRGIPKRVGADRAWDLANMLGFARHFDKQIVQCSGGTKRKISTAVALMGDSQLIFLDEPTTGMDPASKRLVWSCISLAVKAGRSVVLTSHSMEECEAMCSRLTVMVAGKLHCLGSLQHLKSKFSQGYTLIVKCKAGAQRDVDLANINSIIMKRFRDVTLVESYLDISTYYIKDKDLPWSQVFQEMEDLRKQFPIEDYSVTQTTLEQVFLNFTRPS